MEGSGLEGEKKKSFPSFSFLPPLLGFWLPEITLVDSHKGEEAGGGKKEKSGRIKNKLLFLIFSSLPRKCPPRPLQENGFLARKRRKGLFAFFVQF